MYRASEYRIFRFLSWASGAFAITALALAVLYHLKGSGLVYRELAFIFLVFSGFFKVQIYMYKVLILEKRMLHLVDPSIQHFKIAEGGSTLSLVLYFGLFWVTLITVLMSYIPGV